ncbi:hypothetical protein CANARDRAFT_174618 [[Candida] arabinofermentans NRRL YB-2248]|uniref:Histone H1 n=1 Tax=[Candida] arabinofermentans NRRL YB-2248 TaxID=983967 RepID=A0A1E4T744_9ASCO|nr:hypothetical protein CANARDRAFT_174618 [[Candida] arabinofermentans NRRL YB-2248]
MATDTKTAATKKSYKDLIADAIKTLKERNGSSRQAIKKYIAANFSAPTTNFDSQFNLAIKRGVTTGLFIQPKGPSGPVKLNKAIPEKKVVAKPKKAPVAKKATPAAPKKAAAKKATPVKKAAPKKVAPKKKTAVVKKAAPAKKAAPKKKAAPAKKAAPKKAAASKKK